MLYYFNLCSDDWIDIDQHGVDLPSLEAAKREANRAAREMIAELVLEDGRIDGMRFEIADQAGNRLITVRFRDVIRSNRARTVWLGLQPPRAIIVPLSLTGSGTWKRKPKSGAGISPLGSCERAQGSPWVEQLPRDKV